jgi:flagellar protein FliO/FliZ
MDANILQSFGVLILAVGVIAGIMYLLKKINLKRLESRATIDLNVISKISLQPKNHLFIVKVVDKLLVLGVSDNNINILTELDASFEKVVGTKSKQELTEEILKKAANVNLDKKINTNLSFANFLKSSLKFGSN